jgi:hypothetical protein
MSVTPCGLISIVASVHAPLAAIMRQQGTPGAQRAQPKAIEAGTADRRIGRQTGIGCVTLDPQGLFTADGTMAMTVDRI